VGGFELLETADEPVELGIRNLGVVVDVVFFFVVDDLLSAGPESSSERPAARETPPPVCPDYPGKDGRGP